MQHLADERGYTCNAIPRLGLNEQTKRFRLADGIRHQVNSLTLPAASKVVGEADPGREAGRGSRNKELIC